MAGWLTEHERFQDRIEIAGYGTAAAALTALVVYFGALFFYAPVQVRPADEKLLTLLGLAGLGLASLFVPQHRNLGRLATLAGLVTFGLVAAFRFDRSGHWGWSLPLAYALWAYWSLTHPAAVARFRPLRRFEIPLQEGAGGFYFGLAALIVYAWYSFLAGLRLLGAEAAGPDIDPLAGLAGILAALGWMILAAGLRRLRPWARWLAVAALAVSAVNQLPRLLTLSTYGAYWRVLLITIFFAGFAAYLAFAPVLGPAFRRPTPPPPPVQPPVPAP